MNNQIVSDIAIIEKPSEFTTQNIEQILETQYGKLIRWAIIDVLDNKLKISVTYETGKA